MAKIVQKFNVIQVSAKRLSNPAIRAGVGKVANPAKVGAKTIKKINVKFNNNVPKPNLGL